MPRRKSTLPQPTTEPEGLVSAPMPDDLPPPESTNAPETGAPDSAVSDPVLVIDAAEAAEMAVEPPVFDSGMTAGTLDASADAEIKLETGEEIRDSGMGSGQAPGEDELVPPLPETPLNVPPSEAMTDAPKIFSEFKPPEGPGSGAAVQIEEVTAHEEMVALLISDEYTKSLWQRIDSSITEINKRVQSLSMARQLFDQVQAARNELMGGKVNFEEAERLINEVEYRIGQGERVRRWSYTFGSLLFLYELVFAVVMVYLLFTRLISGLQPEGHFIIYMGVSMVFGGLGGVVGAWFSLVKHVAQDQDFEWQHTMWYLTSPLLGVFTGLVVVVISYVGLITLIPNSDTNGIVISTPWSVYLLAFVVGYQHNVFISLLKRVLKVFEGSEK